MSPRLPGRLLPHVVTVRPYTGSGGTGPTYGDPVDERARVVLERQLVRDSTGAEVVVEAKILTRPGIVCPVGSRVTLPGETRERQVVTYGLATGAHSAHHAVITTT